MMNAAAAAIPEEIITAISNKRVRRRVNGRAVMDPWNRWYSAKRKAGTNATPAVRTRMAAAAKTTAKVNCITVLKPLDVSHDQSANRESMESPKNGMSLIGNVVCLIKI